MLYVGTASWSIRSEHRALFSVTGSHLERYSRLFPAVEINSSFYRLHRPETYARWARETPSGFRFSTKLIREITHVQKLQKPRGLLHEYFAGVKQLGEKLGPVLVQFPPKLAFDSQRDRKFFQMLREIHRGELACEPRHMSWFGEDATQLLREHRIARVAADPPCCCSLREPGGWKGLIYFRLHGSPRMYYSDYSREYLEELARSLTAFPPSVPVWCIFDNTAMGAATANAKELWERLKRPVAPGDSHAHDVKTQPANR